METEAREEGVAVEEPVDSVTFETADTLAETRQTLAPAIEAIQAERKLPQAQPVKKEDVLGPRLAQRFSGPMTEEDLDAFVYDAMRQLPDLDPNDRLEVKSLVKRYEDYRTSRGEGPLPYLEGPMARAENQRVQGDLERFGKLFSGREGMLSGLPVESRRQFIDLYGDTPQAEEEMMESVSQAFVERMGGEKVDPQLWPAQRNAFARANFDWKGTEVIDGKTFYQLAGKEISRQQQDLALIGKVFEAGVHAALQGKSAAKAIEDLRKLVPAEDWARFRPGVQAGYAAVHADHSEEELVVARSLVEYLGSMADVPLEQITRLPVSAAFASFGRSDHATREKILGLVRTMVSAEGEKVDIKFNFQGGWDEGVLEIIDRLGSLGDQEQAKAARHLMEQGFMPESVPDGGGGLSPIEVLARMKWAEHDPMGPRRPALRPMTPQEREHWRETAESAEGFAAFTMNARADGVAIRSYIDDKREGWLDTLSDTTFLLGRSGPTTAVSMTKVVGVPVLMAIELPAQREHFRRIAPNADARTVEQMAFISATLSALTDRVQAKTFGLKLPAVSSLFAGTGTLGKVVGKVTEFGLKGAGATGQESFQSTVPDLVQQFYSALSKDVPGVKWEAVREREQQALGDNARVSFLMTLFAGGGGSLLRRNQVDPAQAKRELGDFKTLRQMGFGRQEAEDISARAENDPAGAADDVMAGTARMTPEERQQNVAQFEQEQVEQEQQQGGDDLDGELAPKRDDELPTTDEGIFQRALQEAEGRGNSVDLDKVRYLIPGYRDADPLTRDAKFLRKSAELNNRVLRELLKRKPEHGLVVIMAGGPGSGKSSVEHDLSVESDAVIDTTLSVEGSARRILAQIKDSGREASVVYVHRPFENAFGGVIDRYLKGKKSGEERIVPLAFVAQGHVGAQQFALQLAAEGVDIQVFDNSGEIGSHIERDIDFLEQNSYVESDERRAPRAARGAEEESGRGPQDDLGSDGRGRKEDAGASREGSRGDDPVAAAIGRLVAEGNAILERYRSEGKLTDAEVRAFRGEADGGPNGKGNGGPEGKSGGDGNAPRGGNGSTGGAAPAGGGPDPGRSNSGDPSPEDQGAKADDRVDRFHPLDAKVPVVEHLADGSAELRYPDGATEKVADVATAEKRVRAWEAEESVRQSEEIRAAAREIGQGQRTGDPGSNSPASAKDRTGSAKAAVDQAYARVRQGLAGTGLRHGRGARKVKTFLPGDSLPAYQKGVAKLARAVRDGGGDVTGPLRDHAADIAGAVMNRGKQDEARLIASLRGAEAGSAEPVLPGDVMSLEGDAKRAAIQDAFAKLAMDHAFGRLADAKVPENLLPLFRAVKETTRAVLKVGSSVARSPSDRNAREREKRRNNAREDLATRTIDLGFGPPQFDQVENFTVPEAKFGWNKSDDYEKTFFAKHPDLEGKVWVHHAVEQQMSEKYGGPIPEEEMNSLENLRGIPIDLNTDLHLRMIRMDLNDLYSQFKGWPPKEELLRFARIIDQRYGHLYIPPIL
ncbi:zeta toxin family protein [Luteolibacter sp. GHJ8]|uniref:Zeta toxin family protein n=1 Tax=Luteolibacter rhizosphaerae TaxID=2989719 RepID=A0ABT3GAV4_9BACT|nr:zeta toxin family protein [Luteolibacter rhizosphaerae]MCW1916977.1 zeta toxin family protein [Luteolibacter rhizosphaerae]